MERIYKSKHDWRLILKCNLPQVEDLRLFGSSKLKGLIKNTQNAFWKDVLGAWAHFIERYKPSSSQLLTERLWFNDVSKYKNSIIKSWDSKGIRYVADLISNITGRLYSREEINRIYKVRMTFLCYTSLVRSLPNIIKTSNYKGMITFPLVPYKVDLMNKSMKLSRIAYKEFQTSVKSNHEKSQQRLEYKWKRDINFFQAGTLHDICVVTKNTYLQALHFRLVFRIIPTKYFLHIIGKSESNLCTFCSAAIETIPHLFWDCQHTQSFISEVKHELRAYYTIHNVTKNTWFFPNLRECTQLEIIVNTVCKATIFKAQCKNFPLSINHFMNNLRLEVEKERYSARLNGRYDSFKTKWGQLERLTFSRN